MTSYYLNGDSNLFHIRHLYEIITNKFKKQRLSDYFIFKCKVMVMRKTSPITSAGGGKCTVTTFMEVDIRRF